MPLVSYKSLNGAHMMLYHSSPLVQKKELSYDLLLLEL